MSIIVYIDLTIGSGSCLGHSEWKFGGQKTMEAPLQIWHWGLPLNHMERGAFILVGETSVREAHIFNMAFTGLHGVGFHIVLDGNEVVDYLRAEGKYADRMAYPFPTWMILNFQLPGRSALDVMKWVRKHPACGVVPVLLFSDNPTPDEVKESYDLGVNTVFKKPRTQAEMTEAIKILGSYWSRAQIPDPPPSHKCD
jgi:CheY-like chemotaxis protein